MYNCLTAAMHSHAELPNCGGAQLPNCGDAQLHNYGDAQPMYNSYHYPKVYKIRKKMILYIAVVAIAHMYRLGCIE